MIHYFVSELSKGQGDNDFGFSCHQCFWHLLCSELSLFQWMHMMATSVCNAAL